MAPADIIPRASTLPTSGNTTAHLRLYIARSTPNSVRAQHNLRLALDGLRPGTPPPELEIIDVFAQPKRAIVDGVVVTPTLIGLSLSRRVILMGDLADHAQLQRVLQDFLTLDSP